MVLEGSRGTFGRPLEGRQEAKEGGQEGGEEGGAEERRKAHIVGLDSRHKYNG